MDFIYAYLIELKDYGLIEWNRHNFKFEGSIEYNPNEPTAVNINPHDKNTEALWKHEDMNFHITGGGILVFRKYLEPLSKTVMTKTYEMIVEKTEGPQEVKTAFRGFPDRIKSKIQEKVENAAIDGIIDLGKQYGPPAISFIVKLVVNSLSTI